MGNQVTSFKPSASQIPPLGEQAEITRFWFTDADSVSTEINVGEIEIILEYDQLLTSLTPAFEVSDGSKVFIDRSLQESGAHTYDFSGPVTYTVLSEDESTKTTYLVVATNRETTGDSFRCANVITPNGDNANDTWIVEDVFKYKHFDFRILDANGRTIFESTGYDNLWDGTLRGSRLARGKYYYVVRDPESSEVYRGDILILY